MSRRLITGATATIAAGALLTGVAFAASDPTSANVADNASSGSAIANLARSTTATGEAKGDAISAAARTTTTSDVDETADTDRDAHGDAVSSLARSTTATGEAKGDAISATASSNGKAHRSAQ